MRKLTTEEFVNRSNIIHCNKYDYSKVNYEHSHIKVCIICPEHGEFWQMAKDHYQGSGCPKCVYKERSVRYTLDMNIFIRRSNSIHNNKYDYSKCKYIHCDKKVYIICPEHGGFWQPPSSHIRGNGCKKCMIKKFSEKCKSNKNEFIKKSQLIHNNKYDYSKVEYKGVNKKVCIICSRHGEFYQTPGSHLRGVSCPFCKKSKIEEIVKNIITKHKINNIQSFRGFEWLKNKKPLELDIFLPDYNIGIECQGKQHFEPVSFGGCKDEMANIRFNGTQYNDRLKKDLCHQNGVKLFYINYDDNIEEKTNYILETIRDGNI